MRDIILVVPSSYSLEALQQSLPMSVKSVLNEEERRLSVFADDGDVVEFVRDDSLGQYYEPEELEILSAAGRDRQYYVVHFKDIESLKPILASVANRQDFVIDNDFGLIARGNDFVALCKSRPGWDWASG